MVRGQLTSAHGSYANVTGVVCLEGTRSRVKGVVDGIVVSTGMMMAILGRVRIGGRSMSVGRMKGTCNRRFAIAALWSSNYTFWARCNLKNCM